METLDGIFIFASGAALGIMLGHWLGKKDCNLEYRRGYLDAQWAMFMKIVHDQIANEKRILEKNETIIH